MHGRLFSVAVAVLRSHQHATLLLLLQAAALAQTVIHVEALHSELELCRGGALWKFHARSLALRHLTRNRTRLSLGQRYQTVLSPTAFTLRRTLENDMPCRFDHGVTASVGTDEATKSILLSRVLLIVVVLNRWLGEVNPLEHHNILLDLPRLLILP